jgi:uncharacterized protein YkwD
MKKNLVRKRNMKHKNAYEYIHSLPENEQNYVWDDWLNSPKHDILECLFHYMPASVVRKDIKELRKEQKEMET